MAMLANNLAPQVERVVVDRTGLEGEWDLDLSFAQEARGPLPPGVDLPRRPSIRMPSRCLRRSRSSSS
jgi:uncharacterized protein (TIGR03435 family)